MGFGVSGEIVDIDRVADFLHRPESIEPSVQVFVAEMDPLEAADADGQDLSLHPLGQNVDRRALQVAEAGEILVPEPIGGRRGVPEVGEIDHRKFFPLNEGSHSPEILPPVDVRVAQVPVTLSRSPHQLVEIGQLVGSHP